MKKDSRLCTGLQCKGASAQLNPACIPATAVTLSQDKIQCYKFIFNSVHISSETKQTC